MLKLEDLKVQSFVTALSENEQKEIVGGDILPLSVNLKCADTLACPKR